MVYCEICGAEIKGQLHIIKIERSNLNACGKCAQYEKHPTYGDPSMSGSQAVLSDIAKKYSFGLGGVSSVRRVEDDQRRLLRGDHVKKIRRNRDTYDQLFGELIPDFYTIIRRARQAHGWTQEEFASMVKEKSSLISKIERGDMVPDDELRKKLEHTLAIKLTEQVLEPKLDTQNPKELTFGEIAVIKHKKR
ncbi:MAG: multiprotein bridging factor aMBF1 [Methanocellales archaeon]|nr:multiprotein bridging factor aMBF1 [Methanocellales archaeon]MDD3291279.1 multiprotein bridging factor aMBF1 [Methanocellales archaeon]MDD5235451.1 multiprotein bridging factor aMBF1 [Methanocellales archaeon]MDD5484466.1 multiprotein bridging factor aMBF1 [Methanocellales archaeon]